VSDAITGALRAAVCEVLAVTHYQRQRMMESIDRVRLYQQLPKYNDADCFIVRYSITTSIYLSILTDFCICSIQFSQMQTKHPPSVANDTEDGLSQHVTKKVERGRFSTTTTNDRPTRNVTKTDRQNPAPLLVEYASATISKTAASLPPFDDGVNKNKKASLESMMKGQEAFGATPYEIIVAGSNNIKSTSGVTTNEELLPPTVDDITPSVGISAIHSSHTFVAPGNALVDVSKVAQSIANSALPLDNRYDSSR
jgi:hypothetical protein